MSVCLSAWKKLENRFTDFRKICYPGVVPKHVDTVKFLLKSGNNNGHYTWRSVRDLMGESPACLGCPELVKPLYCNTVTSSEPSCSPFFHTLTQQYSESSKHPSFHLPTHQPIKPNEPTIHPPSSKLNYWYGTNVGATKIPELLLHNNSQDCARGL
jgi:hypothetical protein